MALLIIDTEQPETIEAVTQAFYQDLLPHGDGPSPALQDRVKAAFERVDL